MDLGFTSFAHRQLQQVPKISQASGQSYRNQDQNPELNSLLSILRSKFSVKSSSILKIIKAQLAGLFLFLPQTDTIVSFEEKLAQCLYETFHLKFKTNYHKFLISNPVLDLSYETKIFLLNVFRQYDLVFDQENIMRNNSFDQPHLSKRPPWREAQTLNDPLEIKQYQMKMFMIYKGQFLDVLKNISGEKETNKDSFKRVLARSDKEQEEKQSQRSCESKKKKRKTNALISLEIVELQKKRIQLKVCN